ncbi:MAG: GlcG/HbpS family heme-binding protein [Phycisphaeraceae bacterium]
MSMSITRLPFVFVVAAVFAALPLAGCVSDQGVELGYESDVVALSDAEVEGILDRGVAAAAVEASLLRRDLTGEVQTCRMHIIVVDRDGSVIGRRSMADAWGGSVSIAKSKAYTAAAFSSHENALTTRSLGALTQPGGALWNIGNSNYEAGPGLIEFPGGVPLYNDGRLVGAVGVSGDGVEQDENVAEAAAEGFEPVEAIRIDTVTDGNVPYTQ